MKKLIDSIKKMIKIVITLENKYINYWKLIIK